MKSNLIPFLVRGLLLGLSLAWTLAAFPADESASTSKKKKKTTDDAAELFTSGFVPEIQIDIAAADVAKLSTQNFRGPWRRGNGDSDERVAVQVTVQEGGRTYTNVSLHLKGSAGSRRSIFDKPAMTLNFDKHVPNQTFRGLQRLSLNNSVQDPSYLSEKICRELYAAAGVPVPRAAHAVVTLNGRSLGLYVLLEACNKQFLRRAFGSDKGHLYDGGFVSDIEDGPRLSSGENPEDRSDLQQLIKAANISDPTERWNALGKILDVDHFISFLAMDVILCNTDGYAMNRNNYRIYHNPSSDRLVFLPHGLDQMFGTFRSDHTLRIFPDAEGLVARAVWQTPEGRRRYRERIAELVKKVYQPETINERVKKIAETLQPFANLRVGRTSSRGGGSFDKRVEYLQSLITARGDNLLEQLTPPQRTFQLGAKQSTHLDNWKSVADYGKTTAKLVGTVGKDAQLTLEADGSAVGTWVMRVSLDPGRYKLEGRVKCEGVEPEPGDVRAGVSLRTNYQRSNRRLTGDTDWTPMTFEFDVTDDTDKLFLRCELRAMKGRAWFDQSSLRLTRLSE